MNINAKQVIKAETSPSHDGERLGVYLVEARPILSELVIDLREVAPENLVSTFVNAVLHQLEEAGYKTSEILGIQWLTKFESQAARLKMCVHHFIQWNPAVAH